MSGQHAVVTGGATGIGLAVATCLAKAGAQVTLMGRNFDRLNDAASLIPGAVAVAVDITDETSVESAFADAEAKSGRVSILVNNAGGAHTAPAHRTTLDDWNALLALNLTGTFMCCRMVLPGMKSAGNGRIINIASTAGLKGYGYTSAYVASKHGVVGLTRALATEYISNGITANAICPGFTNTELVERSVSTIVDKTGRSREDALSELVKHNPQKRLVEPSEVAGTALWLCDPESASITGQAIVVAGGEIM